MFSTRHLLRTARDTFRLHDWTKKRAALHVLGFTILFAVLWVISALGPLRIFLPHALQITGWPGTHRTYLIVLQNNAELRATGGFITAFALLEFDHGFPTRLDFQDVYGAIDDHDYIAPPYPLDILLEKDSPTYAGHSFRDANFNPSFPEAATNLLEFFRKTNPDTPINGVFAINFSVIEKLTGLYEPITIKVPASPVPTTDYRLRTTDYSFTRTTLFELLENAVSDIDRHNLEALASRKDIVKPFAKTLIKAMAFSPWKWRELSELLASALSNKEILLYFNRSGLAHSVNEWGWDGSFPEPSEDEPFDLLAVNVSNFGGMKSDRYITREIHYSVELSENSGENSGKNFAEKITADVEVTLRHRGQYTTPLSGEYKGYVRVFAPVGTRLLESSTNAAREHPAGSDAATQNYTAWGDTILMQPGESRTYRYRFELPSTIFDPKLNEYRLHVVKQPGTENDFYEIDVKAPLGQNVLGEGWQTRENIGFFKGLLNRDAHLTLTLLPDQLPPRLFWQEFKGLNTIELAFAEPMDPEFAGDPLNYEIIDLDKNVPGLTDTVTLDYIVVDGGRIELHTRGIDVQPEEFFQIRLRNLRDLNGNPIQPNPRTITVVQRLGKED